MDRPRLPPRPAPRGSRKELPRPPRHVARANTQPPPPPRRPPPLPRREGATPQAPPPPVATAPPPLIPSALPPVVPSAPPPVPSALPPPAPCPFPPPLPVPEVAEPPPSLPPVARTLPPIASVPRASWMRRLELVLRGVSELARHLARQAARLWRSTDRTFDVSARVRRRPLPFFVGAAAVFVLLVMALSASSPELDASAERALAAAGEKSSADLAPRIEALKALPPCRPVRAASK